MKSIREFFEWINKYPKQFYKYSLILLLISLIFFVIEIFFVPRTLFSEKTEPLLFNNSDKYIKSRTSKDKQKKLKKVMEELEEFQIKETLDKSDSIRIEYLLNQYNILKHEKEEH